MNNSDTDECSNNHPEETVNWIAINPNETDFNRHFEFGQVQTASGWESVSFSNEFREIPLMLSEVQGYDGSQDVIVGETRNIGKNGGQVRLCEFDYDGTCDGHSTNDIAWLAFESGFQTVEIN